MTTLRLTGTNGTNTVPVLVNWNNVTYAEEVFFTDDEGEKTFKKTKVYLVDGGISSVNVVDRLTEIYDQLKENNA